MPRIPYGPADLQEPADVVDAIRTRRGGELLHLDRMLLHSPPFAKGWNAFLREVRTGLSLSPRLRELAICAVAALNGADYEFHHHAPEWRQAGATEAQVEAVRRLGHQLPDPGLFDVAEWSALKLTMEMTREVQVTDDTFRAAAAALPDAQQAVELVGVIATYNMVSRFLVTLDVTPE